MAEKGGEGEEARGGGGGGGGGHSAVGGGRGAGGGGKAGLAGWLGLGLGLWARARRANAAFICNVNIFPIHLRFFLYDRSSLFSFNSKRRAGMSPRRVWCFDTNFYSQRKTP